MDSQMYSSTSIHVIPPDTPPTYSQSLPDFEQPDDPSSWSSSSLDSTTYTKELSLQIPQTFQFQAGQVSPYLTSPLSPASSTHSLSSPSGLANALHDFSLNDPSWPSEEPAIDESFPWSADQEVLVDLGSISTRDRETSSQALHLTIPVETQDYGNLRLNAEDESNEMFKHFVNFDGVHLPQDHDFSPSLSDFGSYTSSQTNESSHDFSAPSPSDLVDGGNLLSPTQDNGTALQRRHSHSYMTRPPNHSAMGPNSSLLSPDGHVSKHQRRHSHSQGIVYNNSGLTSPHSPSPSLIPSDTNGSSLQRRHSSATSRRSDGSSRELLSRSRSTSAARSRSPYARPRDLEPINGYPSPQSQSEGHLSPHSHTRTPEHSAPPSPGPYNASPQSEDAFQCYNHATGINYPILQRDTIASEAVLQASAKRRKKAATYQCNQCGQMLTSRDNLNNHTDAHTGVRRHRCDYCHERFRTRSVLKRHQKSAKCPASRHLLPKKKE